MVHNEIVQSSATQVVSMLSSGEVTSLTVREALGRQREKVDPEINAFDSIVSQESQANAGPLCGLPVTVKDQIAVAGHFRNFGLDEPARSLCTTTASVVRRFLDAGAVLSAKTSLPPYAMDFQTGNTRAGRTNNPWDTNRTPGGSSGGGAAAVAAGMSFLDIGADLSGSLRQPASYCGVYSLLPSEGSIDTDGLMLNDVQLAHFARPGAITRSVDDLFLAWEIMSGSSKTTSATSRPKVGVWDFERSMIPTDHHVVEVFETAKSQIADGELELETTSVESLFSPHVYRAFGEIMGYETGAAIPPIARLLIRQSGKKAAQRSAQFLGHVHNGYRRNYSDYQAALEQRLSLREEFDDESQSCDAVLIPVCGVQPFKHRKPESERNGIRDYRAPFVIEGAEIDYWDAMTAFTVPVSLMGNPVVTIPLGLDTNGLPVGAQLVGKRGQEWSLLDIAHRISAQLRPLRNGYLFGHK